MLPTRLGDLIDPGDDDGEYECRNCGTAFGLRRQVCPTCDSFRVERREW